MAVQGRAGRVVTEVVSGLESSQALDSLGESLGRVVGGLTSGDRVKSLLSGTWLGHALHPLMTDLPIGFWTSAVALDVIGGDEAEGGAELLVGLGNISALGAAATGLADWSDAYGPEQRLGLVHGLANGAGLALMTGSWLARRSGARGLGRGLGLAGLGVAAVSAYLGGHLVFSRGMAVQHAGFDIDQAVQDWTDVGADDDVIEGRPIAAEAAGVPILLVRQDGELMALANRCSHAGGPLNEGEFAAGQVTCPWHGSRFALADGCVLRGPASLPQPRFETRVRGGRIEVRAV